MYRASPSPIQNQSPFTVLDHSGNKLIDVLPTVPKVTALCKVVALVLESRGVQLERPQEVVCLLEARAAGEDLVDKVFCAEDVVLAELLVDEIIVDNRDALAVDLREPSFVDKVADGLHGGLAIRDVMVDYAEGVERRLVAAHEDCVVDLAKTKEAQDRANLGGDSDDTAYAHDEVHLWLVGDVELVVLKSVLARLLLRLHEIDVVSGVDLGRLDRVILDQRGPLLLLSRALGRRADVTLDLPAVLEDELGDRHLVRGLN